MRSEVAIIAIIVRSLKYLGLQYFSIHWYIFLLLEIRRFCLFCPTTPYSLEAGSIPRSLTEPLGVVVSQPATEATVVFTNLTKTEIVYAMMIHMNEKGSVQLPTCNWRCVYEIVLFLNPLCAPVLVLSSSDAWTERSHRSSGRLPVVVYFPTLKMFKIGSLEHFLRILEFKNSLGEEIGNYQIIF